MMQQDNGRLYGLIDGAQYPEAVAPWVFAFSPEVRSLFEGLPEEDAGNAAPLLFEIDNLHAEWMRQIDQMDQYRPCLTVLRSPLAIDDLKTHLQRFLFADIGDGMVVLLRFFDPRTLPSLLATLSEDLRAALTAPILAWLYRGGVCAWQHVEIGENHRSQSIEPPTVSLTSAQLDQLEQCDEPYTLMSELSRLNLFDDAQPYATKFQDFVRRYNRAVQWGLSSRLDRQMYCVASYQYGEQFDQTGFIQGAILASAAGKRPLAESFGEISDQAWQHIAEICRIHEHHTDPSGLSS